MESASALELHRLEVPAPHLFPFAVGTFDSLGPLSRASFPHRHTFHEIVHVTGGRGSHVIDLHHWPIEPPNLGIMAAGQVHYWDRVRGLDGHVLLLEDAFLLDRPADRELLRRLAVERPWQVLDPAAEADTAAVFAEMLRESRARRPGMASVVRAYLHILLTRTARLPARGVPARDPTRRGSASPTPADQASRLAARFLRLLDRPGGTAVGRSVGQMAAELGVTSGYLASAVKGATGRTPGRLLRDARVLEAKRLLSGTEMTIAAVARGAGFSDPAYFCRFFRRETGISPGEFRSRSYAGVEIHHGRDR
ncbi:AraC family transcriptional regulator [Nocardiopsis gilva YIM 90087]|uniref:AraC family transcriptional regulator n=1 Tax=Nocardiopsis gilva YIM 90087 TaxID=1235441 RepID=A0A223S7H7_9ACTN|nr:AraC family transcriptional regulator [Nocardiopsis gilva]ASU84022.1 AraC family transcriptional regulator [Nocardiopsis gilva YIM 90087]